MSRLQELGPYDVPRRRECPRLAPRAAGRRTSTSGPRRNRTRSSGPSAIAGSSAADSDSRTSSSDAKTIEVATFRRNVRADETEAGSAARARRDQRRPGHIARRPRHPPRQHLRHAGRGRVPARLHRERRSSTIRAERTIIDYVGGLDDLEARVVRSIGDPLERFQEDPGADVPRARARRAPRVQPRRARSCARSKSSARTSASARPARLMEEYFKLLRSGAAERRVSGLARAGLIEHISPEMEEGLSRGVLRVARAARRLPAGVRRRARLVSPRTILVGSLLVPLGLMDTAHRAVRRQRAMVSGARTAARCRARTSSGSNRCWPCCRSCATSEAPSRAQHALMARGVFSDALTWLEIFGDDRRRSSGTGGVSCSSRAAQAGRRPSRAERSAPPAPTHGRRRPPPAAATAQAAADRSRRRHQAGKGDGSLCPPIRAEDSTSQLSRRVTSRSTRTRHAHGPRQAHGEERRAAGRHLDVEQVLDGARTRADRRATRRPAKASTIATAASGSVLRSSSNCWPIARTCMRRGDQAGRRTAAPDGGLIARHLRHVAARRVRSCRSPKRARVGVRFPLTVQSPVEPHIAFHFDAPGCDTARRSAAAASRASAWS